MITLEQILNSKSDLLKNAKVKIVRHKDGRAEYRDVIKDKQLLIDYQKTQPKDVFKDCDFIISFIGIERRRSVLFGVFKVTGAKIIDEKYDYDLEPVAEYADFIDRLIIDWGNNAISWHQWYHKQPKEVIEILPKGYIGNFPGLLDFVLDFEKLKMLITNPEANYDWYHNLSAVNGVYLILDSKTGMQYVGSANGNNGIWQRWSEYTRSGTGGNKELVALHEKDKNYCRYFRFSVLQALPSNITKSDIVSIENLYKQKLGARAHGLNRN